jgi:hypothetical protein
MRITIRHHYDFGSDSAAVGADLVRPEAWDAARDIQGPFGLPGSRVEWERVAGNDENRRRARDVLRVVERFGARSVCSYGVGTAGVELALTQLAPDLELICTEFAPRTLARLRGLFPEAKVVRHDLRVEAPLQGDLHLLHRIDSELSNRDWPGVLGRFHEPVLLVPTVILGVGETAKALLRRIARPSATRAGCLRNEAALRALWAETHTASTVPVGGATAFLLARR